MEATQEQIAEAARQGREAGELYMDDPIENHDFGFCPYQIDSQQAIAWADAYTATGAK